MNRTWFIKSVEILTNNFKGRLEGTVSAAKVFLVSCVLIGLAGSMPAQAFSFDSMVDNIGKNLKKLGEDAFQKQQNPPNKRLSKPRTAHQQGLSIPQSGYNRDRQMVAEAQRKLTQLGYNAGIADGRYGKKTRLAIRSFQRDRGLPARGNVTPQLLTQLSRETHGQGSSSKITQIPAKTGSSLQASSVIAQPPAGGLVVATSTHVSGPLDNYMFSLLALRYMPGARSDKLIAQLTKLQVGRDQRVYKAADKGTSTYSELQRYNRYGQVYAYAPVFRREQIVDRLTSMVSEELNPQFRKFLESYLKKNTQPLPARYRLKLPPSEGSNPELYYDRNAGYLTTRMYSEKRMYPIIQLSDYFSRHTSLSESLKGHTLIRISELGLWVNSGPFPDGVDPKRGEGAIYAINAANLKGISLPQIQFIALDREVTLKGIKMSAMRAEQIIKAGNRRSSWHVELDFTLSRIERMTSGAGVLVGKLEEVKLVRDTTVYNTKSGSWKPGKREHHRLVLGVFSPDVFSLRAATLLSKKKEKASLDSYAANKRRAQLNGLAVLGIRLGMSIKGAEALIRSEIKVETAYSFSPPPSSEYGAPPPGYTEGFDPYRRGLIFVGDGGSEAVVLYYEEADTVIGITRRMSINHLKKADFYNALLKKYGEYTSIKKGRKWRWGDTGSDSACEGDGGVSASSGIALLEGKTLANVTYKVTGIGIRRDAFKASSLSICKNVLQINWGEEFAEFRLFNHSNYAATLKAIEDEETSRRTSAADKLKL